MSTITWLGHAAFKLESPEVSIVIDPFFTDDRLAAQAEEGRVDLVLVTHDHADHTGSAADICQRTGAQLGAIVGTAERLQQAGVPQEQIIFGGFNMGGTVECKGARITMTQAYHSSMSGAPAGYIITMPDGLVVYHAGDTCLFSGMSLWGRLYPIDVALLPVGGVYTMDARQAAMACGLPCVGFRVGGIPEMIDHRLNGYVADYRSAADLARGMAYVLDDDARYRALSLEARQKALRAYARHVVVPQFRNLYQRIINTQDA